MFRSTLGKAIAILLAIVGVMQLSSKMTVVTQVNEDSKTFRKEYLDQRKQNEVESKKMSDARDEQWKQHSLLEDIGRSLFSVKNSVERYKSEHNKWPEDMTELGSQSEKAADGKYTQSIKIDSGEIYAFLMPKYGDNKIMHLHYTGAYPNKWSCTTNLPLGSKKTVVGMPCTEKTKIAFNGRHFQ